MAVKVREYCQLTWKSDKRNTFGAISKSASHPFCALFSRYLHQCLLQEENWELETNPRQHILSETQTGHNFGEEIYD